jgi:integrase
MPGRCQVCGDAVALCQTGNNTERRCNSFAKMWELLVTDFLTQDARIRPDGRLLRDMYVFEVKKAGQSTGPWDVFKQVAKVHSDQAGRSLGRAPAAAPQIIRPHFIFATMEDGPRHVITGIPAYDKLCSIPTMNEINRAARLRQRARLPEGEKPRAPRAALALAKSKTYQSAADAPEALRACKADFDNFGAWCEAHGFRSLPAEPETVGVYLAAAGLGYALPTLGRRVAAIARAHRMAKQPLDTRLPAIRETLRGIARTHGGPPRRSLALATEDIKRLIATCGTDLAGLCDRALLLLGFAGALRRSELIGLDLAHLRPTPASMRLLIARSKTDKAGEGVEIGIARGSTPETCSVRAVRAWLKAADITDGPIFRRVTQWGTVGKHQLHPDAVRPILLKRAALAGIEGTLLEPITPHGMRAGFITTAYRNGVPDEEIMGHTRHRSLPTMRGYIRRGKLSKESPAGKLGL